MYEICGCGICFCEERGCLEGLVFDYKVDVVLGWGRGYRDVGDVVGNGKF